jgi:hypothetical protein
MVEASSYAWFSRSGIRSETKPLVLPASRHADEHERHEFKWNVAISVSKACRMPVSCFPPAPESGSWIHAVHDGTIVRRSHSRGWRSIAENFVVATSVALRTCCSAASRGLTSLRRLLGGVSDNGAARRLQRGRQRKYVPSVILPGPTPRAPLHGRCDGAPHRLPSLTHGKLTAFFKNLSVNHGRRSLVFSGFRTQAICREAVCQRLTMLESKVGVEQMR